MWSYYSSHAVGTIASQSRSSAVTQDTHLSSTIHDAADTQSATLVSGTINTVSASTSVASYGGYFSDAAFSTSQQRAVSSETFSDSNINSVGTTTSTGAQVTDRRTSRSSIVGFSRALDSTLGTTLVSGDSSILGTTFRTVTDSYSKDSSSWTASSMTSRVTSSSDGGATAASTTFSASGTAIDSRATFNSTTTTFTETTNSWVTTTSTRSSVYPTSTTGSTTTSTSSSDTYTTEKTTTGSATHTSYATTWGTPPFYLDTIIEAPTSEWAWNATASGTGRVTDLATSFTKTTLTDQGASTSVRADTYDVSVSDSFTTSTVTLLSTTDATFTLTALLTSTQSTYSVAIGSEAPTPFTSTTVATISYTSTTTSSFSYQSSFTTTSDSIAQSDVFTRGIVTFTDTYVTTTSTGSSSTVLTDSFANGDNMFFSGSTGSSDSNSSPITTTSYTESASTGITATFASLALNFFNATDLSADTPSYTAASIGRGFQGTSFGRGGPIGTNLGITGTTSTTTTSETTLSDASLASGWPRVETPITRSNDSISLIGSVPATLTNTRVTTRLGGFGWETISTIATVTIGIHQMTTQDSLGATSTTAKTWDITNSTYSLAFGQALAAEVVPLASVVTNATYNPILSFSANTSS